MHPDVQASEETQSETEVDIFKISEVSAKEILEFIDSIQKDGVGIESFNYAYGRLNVSFVFTK